MNQHNHLHQRRLARGGMALGLGVFLLWAGFAQAQTAAGENSIRFPNAFPFLNGHPDVLSVPVLSGGSVGGVAATNNLGATNYVLKSSAFGQNVEHLSPNAYIGQVLTPPVSTSGAPINWPAMTNTSLVLPPDGAFFEPSMKVFYASVGGTVEIRWLFTDGTTGVVTYVVESAPAGRAYRVYWTDDPYNAPKVQLGNNVFVKFHYNAQITAPQYAVTTNVNGIISSNVVAGLFIDSAGSLNAVGSQQGLIVMQYFKTGTYSEQVTTGGVIVIEVMPPDIQTLSAYLGVRILPQGGVSVAGELIPQITQGLMGENAYVYQHSSSDGSFVPKMDWIFPIRPSLDNPRNIEVYWKISDLMGTEWFYEVDWYSADWPPCYRYVRGDGANPGTPVYFPSNMSPSLMTYQEPEDGCAVLQDPQTLTSTTNSGRCLVRLTSQDENVWFLPIQMISRNDPQFDLTPYDWTIGNELRPHDTARSAWFTERAPGKITVTNLNLPGDFTLEGWFKPDNLEVQSNAVLTLFDKQHPGDPAQNNHVTLWLFTGSPASGLPAGSLQASLGSGLASPSTLAQIVSTNLLKSFAWTHVALTLQGRQLTLYINGAKDVSALLSTNGTRQVGATPFCMGGRVGTNSYPFHGFIDNIRLWTNALSASQVQTAMGGNNGGYSVETLKKNGLRAYFPINEGDTLSTVQDLTGRHNAELTNGLLPDVGAIGMSQSVLYSEWHGYIYAPYGTSYNTNLYAYPTTANPSAETYIFGVNTNSGLEVWWSEGILQPDMPVIYIPNWVERYNNVWPSPNASPHIILASGQGSKKGGVYAQGSCMDVNPGGLPGGAILHPGEYFSGSFSLGVWLYLNTFPTGGAGHSIPLSFGNYTVSIGVLDEVRLGIDASAEKIILLIKDDTSSSTLSAPIMTGQWVYVMATVDGSNRACLYINDQAQGTNMAMVLPRAITRTNCVLGYNEADSPNPFDGRIDEVRIWSSVLDTQDRVAAMINDSENMNTRDLVAYFSFDPYKGHLIQDLVSGYKGLLVNANSTAPGAPALGSKRYTPEQHASIYYQNNTNLPGYNPNEEHALLNPEDGYDVAYAFRNDLNAPFGQSEPYVLVNYTDALTGRPGMDVFHVMRTSTVFQTFHSETTAGSMLNGPHPLDLLPNYWTGKDINEMGAAWMARNKAWYALAGGVGPTDTATVIMQNYYPKQPSFWFPGISAAQQPANGTAIPWLPALTTQQYSKASYPTSGLPQAVTWTITWPEAIPTMDVGETLTDAQNGLPDIWDQASVDIVYQQSSHDPTNTNSRSVFLFDPICARGSTLNRALDAYGFTLGGREPTMYLRSGLYYFNGLPPDLAERFYYNPMLSQSNLVFIGEQVTPLAGDPYLMVNVLNMRQRDILTSLVDSNNPYVTEWATAISQLAIGAVELPPNTPFTGIALNAPGSGAGYVVLAFNNATNPVMGVSPSAPISLSLLRVTTNLATGAVMPMEDPYNLLSEQMSMLFTLDFAGEPGNYLFDWRWTEPNPNGTTPSDPVACAVYTQAVGVSFLTLDGQSPEDLINRFFAVRYRAVSNTVAHVVGTNWSEFTTFALAEGWVQRILNSLTPFEQRMRDLYNNPVETSISMIQQAGGPFEGNVALNQDNINNVGLIQLYQTVLDRAQDILDVVPGGPDPDANQQLLLAASRLNDLYMMLGNEAYADAMDPTVGFGSSVLVNNTAVLPIDYGAYASSLFCFDNQAASLLEEELSLLRGRGNASLAPGMDLTPVYNRLYWNYTKGITAGEVAYSVNYDIAGHTNVIIDASVAKERYPQGHGDAWGYYLDAVGVYYKLLRHSTFDWGLPSISPMLMNDVTIDADYFDEKKFAESGAALTRAGLDIIRRTYRQSYSESSGDLFPGYVDSNTNRAWGVGQWGARVGVGALCNWMVGNSLLPLPSEWLTNETSLALEGSGYAQFPESTYFDGDFTIELWVNLQAHGVSNSMGLFSFANEDQTEMVLLELQATNRAPRLTIFTGGTQTTVSADATLATGQWIHVAAVLETNTSSLYINGALAEQASGQLTPATVIRTNNYIGRAIFGGDVSFAGALSDIRIWRGARSVDDITGAMNRRLNGGEEGLVAYWPLNEGSGENLLDRSYNGFRGQTEGAADWINDMPVLAINYHYDDPGILKIDRTTVKALPEIAANMAAAQEAVNNADRGLNPLGLARTAIPFDISPGEIDSGNTHFEQVLARAEKALNNADRVFQAAQESGRLLRQQQKGAYEFQTAAASQEGDYKRRLIEIFGYPYSDDIGTGQTYAQGYDGPDIYHYMYVDMTALGWQGTEVDPIFARTYVFEGEGTESVMDPYGFNTNQPPGTPAENVTNTITFHYAANGLPCKPTLWTGTRRAEGRLQMAYAEFLRQLLAYGKALEMYENNTAYLNETFDWYVQTFAPYKMTDYNESVALATMKYTQESYEAFLKLKALYAQFRKGLELNTKEVDEHGIPLNQIYGMANGGDLFSTIREAIKAAAVAQSEVMSVKQLTLEEIAIEGGWVVQSMAFATEMTKLVHDYKLEEINQETAIGELVRRQQEQLSATKVALQSLLQAYQNMVAVEQEGERLLTAREWTRQETANRIASMRYSDMAFRIFQNDQLSRYNSAFDLAAFYTYMAAKAYDYETGLLPAESATSPGSRFLSDVVRARTLGRINSGEPMTGGSIGDPGLSDILARMKENWAVLDGRLGFNNPQRETSRFSLRTELFRILPGASGDANWRTTLESYKVDNLFDVPEFRRYCIPFASEFGLHASEPGIVIPFSTTIDFGHNFFGRLLAGGDHAYDPSHFATKIRSVGIWFSNYNNNAESTGGGLANTPHVYLIPAGADIIRSPSDLTGKTLRSWQVQDQAIPVPHAIGDADINQADWIPLYDSLEPDSLATLRRFPSMRAYHDAGDWSTSELNYSSRLIGRSVWNTQWYLIIPAGALNSDRRLALEYFINGSQGDGNGIKDIKLFFETYSYSGN